MKETESGGYCIGDGGAYMNSRTESADHYQKALKAGHKMQKQRVAQGLNPNLEVLDEILADYSTVGEEELGILEIPADRIVGTKTRGRSDAFAANFMPLISEKSEFGLKWKNLCQYHLGESGIRDPIFCYEFLGRFYVQEGNKRVSVLKYFDAASIRGKVIRILPGESSRPEVIAYREFLTYYPKTKLYEVAFSQVGSFPRLQAALGYEMDHVWTEEERRNFRSSFYYFNQTFEKLCEEPITATPADALLEWLKVYPFEELKAMSNTQLYRSLESIWPTVKTIGQENIIEVNTKPSVPEEFKNRRTFSMMPSYLNVAFVHELRPENSNWVKAHDAGSRFLEDRLGDQVIIQRYAGVGTGEDAERAMEIAIKNGAEAIFTTTAPMIKACRRVAARHPETKILNCSVCMPYTDVRTYYSRIYEGKFVSGAIAGALSKSDTIGYIASYPIFGVPAGINAFALGVQLTNPKAKVQLKWSNVGGDPVRELREQGTNIVSTLDVPQKGWNEGRWGMFRIQDSGESEWLASPYWDWGAFYVQIAQTILNGEWDASVFSRREERAVNYWWGIADGVIGLEWAEEMPEGTKALANLLVEGIRHGTIDPFRRKIVSQEGTLRNDGSKVFTPDEILHMDWLCENVIGTIPSFDALSPKAQEITRLQGVYRDQIPPKRVVCTQNQNGII